MRDTILREAVEYICRKETVSTNPDEHEYSNQFIDFMDDDAVADFGKWQWANGFNTALVAVEVELAKLPSAEPERKTGLWIEAPRFANDAQPNLKCQFCGTEVDWFGCTKFCGECGAKLRLKLEVEHEILP